MVAARGADSVPEDNATRLERAWAALRGVADPEIPVVSIVDLGIIRGVRVSDDGVLNVGLSPTYTGCPATEVIRQDAECALHAAHLGSFAISIVLSPAWTTDWITPLGRAQLLEHGIVPPEQSTSFRELVNGMRPVACPRCQSIETEVLSEFGSTPCKALYRCRTCLEPFDVFKCI